MFWGAKKTGLALLMTAFISTAASAADVVGRYQTEANDEGNYLHVDIAPCADNANRLCGTIEAAYAADGATNDAYEHLGRLIVWDMQSKEDGFWTKGKIWAPDTDKTYNSEMRLVGASSYNDVSSRNKIFWKAMSLCSFQ